MTSRLKLLVILLACMLSLSSVLYVNNALEIAETSIKDTPGAPAIEVNIEDPCNAVLDVLMTFEVTPNGASLDIKSSRVDVAKPCEMEPFALVSTSNLRLRADDGRVVARDFPLERGPTVAKVGTLERTGGGSSTFAVPLKGDSNGRYRFADNALDTGFGETALQVQIVARNLTCREPDATARSGQALAAGGSCAIPLRAVLQYANTAFDVAAAIPPTYYLVPGPSVPDTKSSKDFSTTRLLWAERATAPSSGIKGTLTGFEVHLVDRHSIALKQFVTVAGSALFGTLVSMLLSFQASQTTLQPPRATEFEVLEPAAQPSSRQMISPRSLERERASTQGSAADRLPRPVGPATPLIALGLPVVLVTIVLAARAIMSRARSGS